MLTDRIIGAFTFRRGVYADVENDPTFTQTAWILVAIIAFLNQLGTFASTDIPGWLISTVIGTATTVLGFAVAAFVISWVGQTLFNAQVTFDELVRTLGLAYVWHVVAVLGIFGALVPGLGCLLGPVNFLAWLLGLAAWLVATKEALDLDWMQTIITVVLGWLAIFIISLLTGFVLSLIGLTASAVGGLFG